jgi:membrane fusion protein, multidrug efflux system
MENQEVTNPETKKKSPLRLIIILLVVLVGGYFGVKAILYSLAHETTDNAQVETQISPVLPRVSGYVKTIAVNDYDSVKAGQLLVQLDDDELQTQLLQMEADYQSAQADIANAKAALNNATISLKGNKGSIDLTEVKKKQAEEDYQRNQNLFADQAITKKQLDDSKYALDQASVQYDNSHTDLNSASSRIPVLQASIQKADASLAMKKAVIEQQKLKISYSKIYAPQAGKIGKRNVSEGQFVQAGSPLFSIVNDTTYWIVANFKETQIKKFVPGMEVEFTLDAYPDTKLKGTIESVSEATGAKFSLLPPDNASGNFVKVTQRVPVKINIKDVDKYKNILRAGLSVDVSVPVK